MLNIKININFIFSYIIMVLYYGGMKRRTGSVNTNQLGLKMSGCPSRVGRNPVNARYISQRVACNRGICGIPVVHEVIPWRVDMTNMRGSGRDFCQERSTTCLAAAGGIGNINTPYYRTPAPGEGGCGTGFSNDIAVLLFTLEYTNLANEAAAKSVVLPVGTKAIVHTKNGTKIPVVAGTDAGVTKHSSGKFSTFQTLIGDAKHVLRMIGNKITHEIKKITYSAEEKAANLKHDLEILPATITTLGGKLIQKELMHIHAAGSHEAEKLQSNLKKLSAHFVTTLDSHVHKLEATLAANLEEKFASQIAKFNSLKEELVKTINGIKDKISTVEELPAKLKNKVKEKEGKAKGYIKDLVDKEKNKLKPKIIQKLRNEKNKLGHAGDEIGAQAGKIIKKETEAAGKELKNIFNNNNFNKN